MRETLTIRHLLLLQVGMALDDFHLVDDEPEEVRHVLARNLHLLRVMVVPRVVLGLC